MFRCTTELKGLIIDADSFEEEIDWHIFDVHYKFFFITSDEQISGRLSNQYGADTVWCVKKYLKLFAPNHVMHGEVLKKNATESYGNSVSFEKYTVLAECNGVSWRNHLDNR